MEPRSWKTSSPSYTRHLEMTRALDLAPVDTGEDQAQQENEAKIYKWLSYKRLKKGLG